MLYLLFFILCVIADYSRGDDGITWKGRSLSGLVKFGYGGIVGGFVAYHGGFGIAYALAYGALFALGSAPGWGHPVGIALGGPQHTNFERWQATDRLRTDIPVALAVRGLIWVSLTPLVLFLGFSPLVLAGLIIMPLAFTAAPYITREVRDQLNFNGVKYNFSVNNAIRGGLWALGLSVAARITS